MSRDLVEEVFVRVTLISLGALPCRKKNYLGGNTRLDFEITRVRDMLRSLFPSCSV
jgi:hypothetical protein